MSRKSRARAAADMALRRSRLPTTQPEQAPTPTTPPEQQGTPRAERRRALREERHRAKHPNPARTIQQIALEEYAASLERSRAELTEQLGREPTDAELTASRKDQVSVLMLGAALFHP